MAIRPSRPISGGAFAGIAVLVGGLIVAGALVYDARHKIAGVLTAQTPPEPTVAVAPAAPAAASAARPAPGAGEPAYPHDPGPDEVSAAHSVTRHMLLSEFLMNGGRLLADPELAFALVSGDDPLVFTRLATASRDGDAQATVALHLIYEFLCNEFGALNQQPNWREQIREAFDDHSLRTQHSLVPSAARHYEQVSNALAEMVLQLAPRCAAAAPDMRRASVALHEFADQGDYAALIALAHDNTHRRLELVQQLEQLNDAQLLEAGRLLIARDDCEHWPVLEPLLERRAGDDPLFAGTLGRLHSADCGGDGHQSAALPNRLLQGAVMGDAASLRDYLQLVRRIQPDDYRIESYALYDYRRRLSLRGCLGLDIFGVHEEFYDAGADARGTHLSPYEFDAAMARSAKLWDQYAARAQALQRCAR